MNKQNMMDEVTKMLSITDRVDLNSDSITEKETKKGNIVLTKKYDFVSKVGNRTSIQVSIPEIINSIEKISAAEKAKNVMSYVICREMANLADSGKLKDMGFKNIAELGRALFGYQTSTSNHYARIGRNFINSDYTIKDGLPELSVSHLIELNSMVDESGDISDIVDMYLDGTLVDGMSTKRLREAIKAHEKEIELPESAVREKDKTDGTDSEGKTETSDSEDKTEGKTEGPDSENDLQSRVISAIASLAKCNENIMAILGNDPVPDNIVECVNTIADYLRGFVG